MDESGFESANPSVHEANKMLRVLEGKRLKYTVRVNFPDGRVIEFQTNKIPKVEWHSSARCLWLQSEDYPTKEIMRWPDEAILLVEENPA